MTETHEIDERGHDLTVDPDACAACESDGDGLGHRVVITACAGERSVTAAVSAEVGAQAPTAVDEALQTLPADVVDRVELVREFADRHSRIGWSHRPTGEQLAAALTNTAKIGEWEHPGDRATMRMRRFGPRAGLELTVGSSAGPPRWRLPKVQPRLDGTRAVSAAVGVWDWSVYMRLGRA